MKKYFTDALIDIILIERADIITTSEFVESSLESTAESTPFTPDSNGFHGEEIPLG